MLSDPLKRLHIRNIYKTFADVGSRDITAPTVSTIYKDFSIYMKDIFLKGLCNIKIVQTKHNFPTRTKLIYIRRVWQYIYYVILNKPWKVKYKNYFFLLPSIIPKTQLKLTQIEN